MLGVKDDSEGGYYTVEISLLTTSPSDRGNKRVGLSTTAKEDRLIRGIYCRESLHAYSYISIINCVIM